MSGTVSLISSAAITQEELVAFLRVVGAVTNPDEVFDGRLSKGEGNVWIVLDNSEQYFEPHVAWSVAQKLGGDPRTTIVIEIGNAPESRQLAAEFACAFAKNWPCVVYDLVDTVYSAQELLELCRTGKCFNG